MGQAVDDYVTCEFQRNFYLSRLLPKPSTTNPKSSSKNSVTATTGRTSIHGKYYPLKLALWEGCEAMLATSFQEMRAVLGDRPLFPSKNRINVVNDSFLEDLPLEFVNGESYLTELRTSFFLHDVLEKPVSRVLNAFLTTHKIFFNNQNAGAHIEFMSREHTQDPSQSDQETSSEAGSDAGSRTDNYASGGEQGGGQGQAKAEKKRSKVPTKVQPDCIVSCVKLEAAPHATPGAAGQDGEVQIYDNYDDDGDDEDDGDEDDGNEDDSDGDSVIVEDEPASTVYRIAFGEHKAAHRLRAVTLDRLLKKGIHQDYIVQMARRKVTGVPSTDTKKTIPGSLPGQIYYTYALAQTFHYMVSAGILYGYLASGDTLTFLHIPPAEPTTLMYRPFLFPQFGRVNAGPDAATEPTLEETVTSERSTVGLLSSLAFVAWKAGVQDERWRMNALQKLARFPDLPESVADSAAALSDPDSPSSPADSDRSSKRGSDGMDDDDSGDSRGRRRPGHHLSAPHAHRSRVPSPLQQHQSSTEPQSQRQHQSSTEPMSQRAWQGSQFGLRKPVLLQPSRFDPVSFRPIRPYCTQACLLGLARGLPLDNNCPNVLLHQRATRGVMTADDVLTGRQGQMLHAISGIEELGQLVVLQLYSNITQDCECLINKGFIGRIGCIFKLTLTGYGYTFMAKGVQSFDHRRLRRETPVYEHLSEQQGRLVPVYLGIVKLLLPCPRDDARLISHMMLMSYGGPRLWSPALARRIRRRGDLAGMKRKQEAARTWEELQVLGVNDDDVENMENNFTWCDEAQRMMRVDFHCARVVKSVASQPVSEVHPGDHVVEREQEYGLISAETTPQAPTIDSARVKRLRPTSWSDLYESDDRTAKRVFRRRGSESFLGSLVML